MDFFNEVGKLGVQALQQQQGQQGGSGSNILTTLAAAATNVAGGLIESKLRPAVQAEADKKVDEFKESSQREIPRTAEEVLKTQVPPQFAPLLQGKVEPLVASITADLKPQLDSVMQHVGNALTNVVVNRTKAVADFDPSDGKVGALDAYHGAQKLFAEGDMKSKVPTIVEMIRPEVRDILQGSKPGLQNIIPQVVDLAIQKVLGLGGRRDVPADADGQRGLGDFVQNLAGKAENLVNQIQAGGDIVGSLVQAGSGELRNLLLPMIQPKANEAIDRLLNETEGGVMESFERKLMEVLQNPVGVLESVVQNFRH
ncbi:hypothetical protein M427DRAFT_62907 [Gonapodya prolifera JEL478]|uniref:Uncharacterized protein n=1 Tax=Gonapodya prolifera (strain JEL478) TaxID=1344416 RepID=A0A139A0C7_GONPJ|nr:hypothetical protein M427DRAFT_62907 [Gonapodya prolifera JEL478]|eukprot:KXS10174.1 hypothetical protein M427DRAFT_62907 [Gonapodya prolifera JEL478]